MNLYFKYGPLWYTIRTRILQHKVKVNEDWSRIHFSWKWKIGMESLSYIYHQILFWGIPLIVIYLSHSCNFYSFILSVLLYLYNFIIFLNFYEIGYLYNDLQGIKKEKKPTLYIDEKLPNLFYYKSIIIRIFFWCLLLIPLYFFDKEICLLLSMLLTITQIIFFIHNKIRKYFYNWITIFFLRFLKMSLIFISIYFLIRTFNSEVYTYTLIIFLLQQYFISFTMYSNRFWFNIKDLWMPYGLLQHWYNSLATLLLFLFSSNYLFLIYFIIYLILFIKSTPKHYFKLKNDR